MFPCFKKLKCCFQLLTSLTMKKQILTPDLLSHVLLHKWCQAYWKKTQSQFMHIKLLVSQDPRSLSSKLFQVWRALSLALSMSWPWTGCEQVSFCDLRVYDWIWPPMLLHWKQKLDCNPFIKGRLKVDTRPLLMQCIISHSCSSKNSCMGSRLKRLWKDTSVTSERRDYYSFCFSPCPMPSIELLILLTFSVSSQ